MDYNNKVMRSQALLGWLNGDPKRVQSLRCYLTTDPPASPERLAMAGRAVEVAEK
jgi:hypothetical protein